MATRSLRVLCQVDLPSGPIRMWDGSGGPFLDSNGNIFRSCILTEDAIDTIEMAINAEAFTLSLVISGIDQKTSNSIWADYQAGTIKGSRMRIMIQKCDEFEQAVGAPQVKFTGKIDNLIFTDVANDQQIRSSITVEVTNRFTMRTLTSGAVLSDSDQKARSAVLNPGANPDRFAERVPMLRDKTIRWPNW
ncbi:hypothetical protein [Agrobacterium tumefaciens]|uniref:hypothetical protein n=1 Tax=Agrobacterium tumefaciens TaxID=358 RepID=UPI0015747560|nr:hypothetical protein [Agrobacterium tumefaciens]NSX92648.1 hypothetical protein [Agrobacterium tumefaciens]NSX92709.1 hypothetical protein [Agrobacterium tumefaciens]